MNLYTIKSHNLFIHDRPRTNSLDHLFKDSCNLFQIRINQLGSMNHVTTKQDSHALRIMLEVLITTKQQIQSRNIY